MTCPQSDAKLEPIANWPLAFSRAFFSMQSFLLPDWLIVINLVFPLLNQMHSIRESNLTYFLSPTGLFWVVNFRCHRKVIHGVQIFIVLLVTEIIKQQHSLFITTLLGTSTDRRTPNGLVQRDMESHTGHYPS